MTGLRFSPRHRGASRASRRLHRTGRLSGRVGADRWPRRAFNGNGYFLAPTLIDHVTTDMSVYTDEIFGPVLSVVRTDSYDDAVQLIQDNRWVNGAAIFTRDGGAARGFQDHVEAGMVGINVPIPVPVGYHSFGGWNDSLFGDTSMYGPEGVRFFTRPKVVTSRWPAPADSSVDLRFPRGG